MKKRVTRKFFSPLFSGNAHALRQFMQNAIGKVPGSLCRLGTRRTAALCRSAQNRTQYRANSRRLHHILANSEANSTSRIPNSASIQSPIRDLHENKVPVDWVSASLNPRRLKVERSRNRAYRYAISPQIPYLCERWTIGCDCIDDIDPALLPLATLAAATTPAQLLRDIAQRVNQLEWEQRREVSSYVQVLAGLKFEKSFIRQIFREGMMRESVIYQEILQEGRQEGERSLILLLLEQQVGQLPDDLRDRVSTLSLEQLEALAISLLNFTSQAELEGWLLSRKSTI